MTQRTLQIFNGSELKVVNMGEDRESWGVYEYKIFDDNYLLWQGYVKSAELKIDDLSVCDKKIIELNLKFKNIASISNNNYNYVELKEKSAESFIDWLLYNDDYHFRNKISFKSITILENIKCDSSESAAIYNATVIKKSPYGNVVSYKLKNTIDILRKAYCKKEIEILALYKEGNDSSELFKIKVDKKGNISLKIKYIEETLLPSALPGEAVSKIKMLKES